MIAVKFTRMPIAHRENAITSGHSGEIHQRWLTPQPSPAKLRADKTLPPAIQISRNTRNSCHNESAMMSVPTPIMR
jgi:hypothetical protein